MSDQWDPEKRGFVVYLIRNVVNGKGYVGFTLKALHIRLSEHIFDANVGSRGANGRIYALQAAIRKYGPKNFTIEQLSFARGLREAQELERHYIDELGTYASGRGPRKGYNMSRGGEAPDLP